MDEVRGKEGNKAAIVGVCANTFLTIFNITIGVISGSYALISEGAHTLSDIATTIMSNIKETIGVGSVTYSNGEGSSSKVDVTIIIGKDYQL